MLTRLSQRLRPKLHADFISVELSDNYQSLSRRLQAMQHHQPTSQKQLLFPGCLLALLAALGVIPWRVVAQETPALDRGRVELPPIADSATEPPAETPTQSGAKPASEIDIIPVISRNLCTLAFSHDGETFAGGSENGILRLWDWHKAHLRREIEAHEHKIQALHFSADDIVIQTVSKNIKSWNVESGKLVSTVELELVQAGDWVDVFTFSPDGNLLAGLVSKDICLWNTKTGKIKHRIPSARSRMGTALCAAFSNDGKRLAVGTMASKDGGSKAGVHIFDIADPRGEMIMETHPNSISSVAFSPDGKLIAGGDHRKVRIWDTFSGKIQATLEGHSGVIESLEFSADGTKLASGGEGPELRDATESRRLSEAKVWEVKSGKLFSSHAGHLGRTLDVAFSPNGRWLARCDSRSLICEELKGVHSWVKYFTPVSKPPVVEPSSATVPPIALGAPKSKPVPLDATTSNSSPEKLIVGTWRGWHGLDPGGRLIFRADGTFEESPVNLMVPPKTTYNNYAKVNVHGRWKLAIDKLELTAEVPLPDTKADKPKSTESTKQTHTLTIALLNDSLLRVRIDKFEGAGGVYDRTEFYRRLSDAASLKELANKIPTETLRIAELAEMDAAEAMAFQNWRAVKKIDAVQLQVVERAALAAGGKISLPEMFQFTLAERTANTELKKLDRSSWLGGSLFELGMLTPVEYASVKKMKTFHEAFNSVYLKVGRELIESERDQKRAVDGSQNDETTENLDPDKTVLAALQKLDILINSASKWLNGSNGPFPAF